MNFKEIMNNIPRGIPIPSSPDYSNFLDDDIKAMFENTHCLSFEPLLAQLIKEIRLMKVIEK